MSDTRQSVNSLTLPANGVPLEAGARFGVCTVVGEAEPYVDPRGRVSRRWTLRCRCGREHATRRDLLRYNLRTVRWHSCSTCYRAAGGFERLRELSLAELEALAAEIGP